MIGDCFRDASYTTQPLELLNSLGFENSKSLVPSKDSAGSRPDSPSAGNGKLDGHQFDINENRKAFDTSLGISGESSGKNLSASSSQVDNEEMGFPANMTESEGLQYDTLIALTWKTLVIICMNYRLQPVH